MTAQFPAEQFVQVRAATLPHRGEYGRMFDLHPALYALTFGGYMAYIALMGLAFADKEMAIPVAIFFLFVIAGFGTPAIWARIAPAPRGERPRWATFMREGFECMTGHVSAKGAMVQVLIMPVLLLVWGLSVAIIAACVR